jgi:hypothetical protein
MIDRVVPINLIEDRTYELTIPSYYKEAEHANFNELSLNTVESILGDQMLF